MRTVAWITLLASSALLASAQVRKTDWKQPSKRSRGECGVPLSPKDSHANLADKYIMMTSFSSGDQVLYACDVGYVPTGGSRSRVCTDGQWKPLTLKCDRRSCGNAGEIANGQFTYTGTRFGDKATAACDEGHSLVGQATRTCTSKGWDGRVPVCEAVACEEPPKVVNARTKGLQEPPYLYGSVVSYQCHVGTLVGQKELWCTEDGTWSAPAPTCRDGTCPPPNVPHAYWTGGHRQTFQHRETVSIECSEGYVKTGPTYVTCDANGRWYPGLPKCQIPEGHTACSTPAVANSMQRCGPASVYQVGDNMTVTCSRGFQLDGAPRLTCGPGGQWRPQPPRCLPSPDKTQQETGTKGECGVPLSPKDSHANLADKYIMMTSFSSGDQVLYACDVGYVPTGGSRSRVCTDGQWKPLTLKCDRRSCGNAGEIANGQFTYTGTRFGDKATAACDEGHSLVGQATRTCTSKGWDGRVPVCEAVACEEPPKVVNARTKGLQEPPYLYRSVVSYQCHVGTLVGQKELWCTEDGTWSAPAPTCRDGTCPPPNVPHAYWTGGHRQTFQHRETVSIACSGGYVKTGPTYVTCDANGRWYPGLPECQIPARRMRG